MPTNIVEEDWIGVASDINDILVGNALNLKSNPGFPFNSTYATSGQWINDNPHEIIIIATARIKRLMSNKITTIDGFEIATEGYGDYVRLFIKDELHSDKKTLENRPRLIKSPSLIDKVIAIYLYSPFDKQQIAQWDRIPSKPGISFDDEGYVKTRAYHDLMRKNGPTFDSDMTNWDYSVSNALLQDATEFRIQTTINITDNIKNLFRNFQKVAANMDYVNSDGFIIKREEGVQDSGRQDTSSTNSFIRSYISFIIAYLNGKLDSHLVMAGGDDCVENYYSNSIEMYKRMGHAVKEYHMVDETGGFEFCSHFYPLDKNEKVKFLGAAKTIANLLLADKEDVDTPMLLSILNELRYNPEKILVVEYLKANYPLIYDELTSIGGTM